MFKRGIFAVGGVLILAIFVLSTDAHAIKFKGGAWVAHHSDSNGLDVEPDSVKLNKFKIKKSSAVLNFLELTKEKKLLWFEIKKFKDKKKYTFSFKDSNNNKYKGKAKFRTLHNQVPPLGAVPEPATILLLGSGLLALAGIGRKKFKKIQ